jgi:osmotically-inducible protein OsmY
MRLARRKPDRPSQRPPPGLRALLLALASLVLIPPAFSGDRESEQKDADARQKLYVRRVLNDDPTLAPYTSDVWVEVQGTTVILSGKVPSAVHKQRAVFLTGQVKGIAEVRSDGLEVVARDGIPDLPSPFIEGVPPRGALAGNHKDGHTAQEPKKAALPEIDPGSASSQPSVNLLAPIHVSGQKEPIVEILPPRPLPQPTDLSSAVEALRRKEDRFRRLKVEVRQKTIFVSGTVSRWPDVNDLTNAIRRLPGVDTVIVDNVTEDRSGGR